MGHNSFIKGSITHVSLGFSHYLLVQLHLVEGGGALAPTGRWNDAPSAGVLRPHVQSTELRPGPGGDSEPNPEPTRFLSHTRH